MRFFWPKTGDLQKKKKKKEKVFTAIARDFPAEIAYLSGFSGQKHVMNVKNVTKSGVSPQKTPILASSCAPEAPSLLISSGHNPRLGGGTIFVWGAQAVSWGGTAPECPPPRGAGSEHESSLTAARCT